MAATIFRSRATDRPARAITAAAHRIDLGSKPEARKQRSLRMAWQQDAFVYRNSIGELRYAVNFLANCAARMRVYVAARANDGKSNVPLEVSDPALGAPPEVIAAAERALATFTNGTNDMSEHMRTASTNITLTGEGFILGTDDPATAKTTYSIRSVSEISVVGDAIVLREGPVAATGQMSMLPLDPATTDLARIWQVDPEYRVRADSAVRAIINECEALLIMRRTIRAVGRSRLAGSGVLLVPDELDFTESADGSDDQLEADPFIASLTRAMMTPISDEGSAMGVMPLVVRGASDALKEFRHVDFARSFDEWSIKIRAELVGVIATGLDIPKEVVMGVADLNHWSAWQVDDNTFRHHVEPHVIVLMNCFTDGYLKAAMAAQLDPETAAEWLPRITFWYDPTELVTHPDLTANAKMLHDALAISDSAFRKALGFSDADAPDAQEIEIRMIRTTRNFPPNLLMALFHELDPNLAVPAMTKDSVPGIKPGAGGGADVPPATPLPAGSTPVATGDTVATPATPATGIPGLTEGPPMSDAEAAATAHEVVAAMSEAQRRALQRVVLAELRRRGFTLALDDRHALMAAGAKRPTSARARRLSKRLTAIDRELRSKIQAAANAALLRQLEKAGIKINQKVAKQPALRASAASVHVEYIAAKLGREVVERTGLTASDLMHTEWETLETQWRAMVGQAQRNAVAIAAQLAGVDELDAHAAAATAMSEGLDAGWNMLRQSLDTLAVHALYNPHPNMSEADMAAALNPDSLVPTGVVRAAIAVAGGAKPQDFGIVPTVSGAEVAAVPLGTIMGGVGGGTTISDVLTNFGASNAGYEWEHGPSDKPFPPHEDLDGTEFDSFDDSALANDTGFPENAYFFPGDHIGCLCDVTPLWVTDQDVSQAMADSAA